MNKKGKSVNTKLSKPPTSGTKLYSITLLPKSKVIPKVVEKNDLSKSINSHLTTNKIIDKCTKVLAPGILKIESELINTYFKDKRVVHQDYLIVTKEHITTLQELLKEARALKPLDEHIDYNANVKNVSLSNNSDTICLSCNECLFSANYDACLVKYLKKMQKHKVAKSAKQKVKSEWKPRGRVFKIVGLKWIPRGRTFNLVTFLRTKDKAPEIIIKFWKQAQVSLNATVRYLRSENGTGFINKSLRNYTKEVGITYHTSTAHTPQQNGVVERRNRTLVEAARTMLIFSKSPLFILAEVVATACYT
ncbi:putative ribonuclease H-like domain-containing protein [Tanacetum coccineum]